MNLPATAKAARPRLTLPSIVNVVLALAGLVNLCAGTVYLIKGDGPLAGAGIGAGLVLLLASTIDRFESLKGLGMEAKTRELSKTLVHAELVLDRMKRLAELTAGTLVDLVIKDTRPFAPGKSAAELYELSRSVKSILEDVGTGPEAVRAALRQWAFYACYDLSSLILKPYEKMVTAAIPHMLGAHGSLGEAGSHQALADMQSRVRDYLRFFDNLSPLREPGEFVPFLRTLAAQAPPFVPAEAREWLTAEVQKWAPEMEYLAEHLDFKNRKMWLDALDAPPA